jgi:CheY-like chemotaxis protein
MMPEMDGFEMTRQIRQEFGNNIIKKILACADCVSHMLARGNQKI